MVWTKCKNCGKETQMHSKELCITCYKKLLWKPKKETCKRCKREIKIHAKGLCPGCYNFVFHLKKNKAWNQMKNYGLDYKTYKKITQKCVVCGFDKIVDLHHLDENKENNTIKNLIGLCPNHHRMLHNYEFRAEIRKKLQEKGHFLLPDVKLK